MNTELEQLDDKNIELCKVLYEIKESLELYKITALNAGKIKSFGAGKTFFAYVQMLAQKSVAINMCCILEKQKGFELNSIPGLLSYIRDKGIAANDQSPIDNFISKYGKSSQTLEETYSAFYSQHKQSIERIKNIRDKRIAHSEHPALTTAKNTTSLPSYDAMEKILTFGIDFYPMVARAYLENIFPVDYNRDAKVLTSTCSLLKKMGIDEITKDFAD